MSLSPKRPRAATAASRVTILESINEVENESENGNENDAPESSGNVRTRLAPLGIDPDDNDELSPRLAFALSPSTTGLQSRTPQRSTMENKPQIPRQSPTPTWYEGFSRLSLAEPDQERLLGSSRRHEVANWIQNFNHSLNTLPSNQPTQAAPVKDGNKSRTDVGNKPALMAISTTEYQAFAKEIFNISDGRFTFLEELKNMDEPFYVAPPPSPANSECGDGEERPSYFRTVTIAHTGLPVQFVNVVPVPGQAPEVPVGPTPPTGLMLFDKYCNPLKKDAKVGDYPPGNAAGNKGFHIFLDSESGLKEFDTSQYRSDYYNIPLFEPGPSPPERVWELQVPSSNSSDSSDFDMQQWKFKCLPPRQEQTSAQAMILFLHQHGWTEGEIARKLGPLEDDFLSAKQSSRWYRGARLPDVYGLSMELVDRICEHTAAEIKPWELSAGEKPPVAALIKWRIRDRNIGLLVVKVVENYLYKALEGLVPHTDVNYF